MKPTPTTCHCAFPSPTEEEFVTIPGPTPSTATRVYVETSGEGYVRIEQLVHSDGLGWYVQKSMVIPAAVLSALLPHLRKADCLMPRRPQQWGQDSHKLFPASGATAAEMEELRKRA
jgi:hypothetical protein